MNKQYLNRGYKLRREIEILELKAEELGSNLDGIKGISYNRINVEGGPIKDESILINKIQDLIELENVILKKRYELLEYQDYINSYVDSIKEYKYKKIFILRNLKNYTWEKIAEKMGYSSEHTQRLHKEILKNYEIS